MAGRRIGAGIAGFAVATAWLHAVAQPLDLSVVNESNDWAAGCGTDEFGVSFCAVQKSNGPQALGYVLEERREGLNRQIRIALNTLLIDVEGPVTIQVDQNAPLVWPAGSRVIEGQVISLGGDAVPVLLRELETGESVVVTVAQKTGEPLSFELALDGFSDAIAALEQTQIGRAD